jgi:hypothetical protein
MASRAATLVKPKTRAKLKTASKSSSVQVKTAKSASLTKTAAKVSTVKNATTKVPAKPAARKAEPVKVSATKKPAASTAAKATTVKAIKPNSLTIKPRVPADGKVEIAATASFEPATPKPRRRTKGEIRTRIYWAVFNQSLRRVAVFEFDQKGEAEKRAAKLAKSNGEHHFIQKIKAIIQ